MPVEKIDFAYISQEKKPFTTHLNSVLQNLKNPMALGIWAYLSSLPEGWKVNKEHLRKHFGLGRDKLDSIIKYLIENDLLEAGQERLDDGKMGRGYITVKVGYDFKHDCKVKEESYPQNRPYTEKPLTAQPYTAKPGHGKSAPINNINNINKTKSREPARKKREPLPNPFVFNQKAMDLLCETSKRVNMPNYQLIAKFENVMKSNGKKSCDWNAEFENFLINEKDIKQKMNKSESKVNQEIRCTVPDYIPDAPIKRAKIETVDKHMESINKLLSRKVINGRVSTRKEER